MLETFRPCAHFKFKNVNRLPLTHQEDAPVQPDLCHNQGQGAHCQVCLQEQWHQLRHLIQGGGWHHSDHASDCVHGWFYNKAGWHHSDHASDCDNGCLYIQGGGKHGDHASDCDNGCLYNKVGWYHGDYASDCDNSCLYNQVGCHHDDYASDYDNGCLLFGQ